MRETRFPGAAPRSATGALHDHTRASRTASNPATAGQPPAVQNYPPAEPRQLELR